jgi:hypothetical protein
VSQVTYIFFVLVPEGSGHVADPTLLTSITLELRWYLSHLGTPLASNFRGCCPGERLWGSEGRPSLEAFDDFDCDLELIVSPI